MSFYFLFERKTKNKKKKLKALPYSHGKEVLTRRGMYVVSRVLQEGRGRGFLTIKPLNRKKKKSASLLCL